ncbi:sensor histidine kinase [Meridianimarinicoccus aquatilis]|uniref:histidine kinase n=1 Tax=Meridianimarinicoccus aquatilis TaxID=2552766 RepID=A0A4V3BBH8_9RHOB|nr:HAMP domain-containing sensor histidine kinase [Fluviibacterium aquatile]QIE42836.1 HAMP domain-containing histidine kinase [Rhodobacteraceae bacterium SC52]TDL87149.1 HAMP domain-containing histidine kinase [Fluviibacterium aquatile]
MFNSLSGRFLILTIAFVMLAEIMIFVPSIARFREDYLLDRLERAQIASLALLADGIVNEGLETELLENAGVYNVVLRRDAMRQLILSSPIPTPISNTFDLRDPPASQLIRDALDRLLTKKPEIVRVIGSPTRDAGLLIEVTMDAMPLREAMLDYGLRILVLSALISALTASLLFFAVRRMMVTPIRNVVAHMKNYAEAPEDARRIISPTATVRELRDAEVALQTMQTDLTSALRQKERLAQLGGAVAKVSHDLRNILTTAQLFADMLERSDDPRVKRSAPKLVGSISRAVNLCEGTLAFGKAEEPPPKLDRHPLHTLVEDTLESERMAGGESLVTLINDVPPGFVIRCDAEQVLRIVGNLVRNARQAIEVTGAAGQVRVKATESETDWNLIICDTGPGLPPKARENLFKPFQGSFRKGGIGLGLVIASELVRGHGGNLRLVSSDESGTVFAVDLPKDAATPRNSTS